MVALLTQGYRAPTVSAQAAPNLGTSAPYGGFSGGGAIKNTGLTVITGDLGTYVGSVTGFPPGIYTGALHVADAAALVAKNDVTLAYRSLNDAVNIVKFDTALGATMGNGQILTPRTYGRGDLTTISGNLTFDAKGNPDAIFIIKIGAALNVAKNTQIILANQAAAKNIYWAVGGAVSILDFSTFKGTILADGAIHLYGGSTLEGRALAVTGAITFAGNDVRIPTSPIVKTLVVLSPVLGQQIKADTKNFQISWNGVGVGLTKRIEYSLNNGLTWSQIGILNGAGTTYSWDLPDSTSNSAFVRVTDENSLRGVSGRFSIVATTVPDSITVVRPSAGEILRGTMLQYAITWRGTGIAPSKTFHYSLDSGITWTLIGTTTTDGFVYYWDVPDTSSTNAMVRITDSKNLVGRSKAFMIAPRTLADMLIVLTPKQGDTLIAGTTGYQVTWTGVGIDPTKTIEYSADGGATWTVVDTVTSAAMNYSWDVPLAASNQLILRITDANGLKASSGMFTIVATQSASSIIVVRPATGEIIASGNLNYIIEVLSVNVSKYRTVEYSSNDGYTWEPLGFMNFDDTKFVWMYVPLEETTQGRIRITDTTGITGISGRFSIRTTSDVASEENHVVTGVSISPVPSSQLVNVAIEVATAGKINLTIVNNLGQVVRQLDANAETSGTQWISIRIEDLPSGAYSLVMRAGSQASVFSLPIVR